MKLELRDLTPGERQQVQARFEGLAARRFAPSARRPRQEVWWPKAPLDGRAFAEGIHPGDADDAFNESARLLGFLNSVGGGAGGGAFYVGNLSAPRPFFRHSGRLDAELARWVRTRLVSNPTCLLAAEADVLLITDSQMHYSVIGAPPEIIERFERRFGGGDALRRVFTDFVEQMRVGSGLDDLKWARDYLLRWSGWA